MGPVAEVQLRNVVPAEPEVVGVRFIWPGAEGGVEDVDLDILAVSEK